MKSQLSNTRHHPRVRYPAKLARSLAVVLLVAGFGSASVQADVTQNTSLVLKPTLEQRYATSLATRLLTNLHYKDIKLDDDLSNAVFDKFIELLDPNRSYFLAGDIRYLEKHRNELDDAISHAELDPAYEVFNIYVERVSERVTHAKAQLASEMDFSVDETYRFDRTEADWARTTAELNEVWRKRVKNDYLRLKLTGKEGEEITELLNDRYDNLNRRINELNGQDVFQYFMNSVTQAIEPHTSYLSPRTSENFEISMRLSLEGIGALLDRQTEYTSIARIVPGGPAERDGRLKEGDRIIGVGQGDGAKIVDVIGWRLDDVVELIRGPKDSVVQLEVLPEDAGPEGKSTMIDIVRGEVKLEEQAAQKSIIEVPNGNDGETMKIGIIDLPVFYLDFTGRAMNKDDYRSSTRDVRRLIGELEEEGVAGIIMDLRNNGGGSLLEATTLTGLFIDQGPVVQVRDSNGRVKVEYDTESGMAWDGPFAVLVNRYSASASEIFAAAIQDYGRGMVIGEPTYGKGTVQNLINLDEQVLSDHKGLGQLKLTMYQFFRVNGGSTQNRGVEPDIFFPSVGKPEDWGESAMDNALPWTKIEPAEFAQVEDLSNLVEVVDSRYDRRIKEDEEFDWLWADIREYNEQADKLTVSLLEEERRKEMDEQEARSLDRRRERAIRNGEPLPELEPELAVADNPATAVAAAELNADGVEVEEEEDDFDLLLNEAARVLKDLIELKGDGNLMAQELKSIENNDSPIN